MMGQMASISNQAANPLTAAQPKDLSGALRSVLYIFDHEWHLSNGEAQTLLGCSRATYFRWKQTQTLGDVSKDTLERLSYVLGIYKALRILIPDINLANTWLQNPNSDPYFGGLTPLKTLMGGQVADLYRIRTYLDGWRG